MVKTMIRAVLIDDERLAVKKLEIMLTELNTVTVIASFTDPVQAIQDAENWNADVIFLDIDMPEMNGMQAAERLQKQCPRSEIVFVTAYNNHALEAFELNALDYVLKPVRSDRLLKTVKRLEERIALLPKASAAAPDLMIRAFQSLGFERGGELLSSFRWRTSKAQEMFAYMLHNRDRFVSKDSLIELFWPDFDFKRASTHLYTTIYQLRQSLKHADIQLQISNVSGGEGYTLESSGFSVDTVLWEEGLQQAGPIAAANEAEHQRLFEMYTGDYLDDYDYLWAESERQRLRTIWLHHAIQLAEHYTGRGSVPQAVTVYQRIVQLQPYYEQGHLGLMKIYQQIGERTAVEEQYHTLKSMLARELHVEPPEAVEKWYAEWKRSALRMP